MSCSVGNCPDDDTLEVEHQNGVTASYCGRHGGIYRIPRERFFMKLGRWVRWKEHDQVTPVGQTGGTGS